MIEAQPTSVFTYEYLIAACEGSDPRILNYVYDQAVRHVPDNALLLGQYAEFLEELDEYEGAGEMFKRAYNIMPTDDLARSVIRVIKRENDDLQMCVECNDLDEASRMLDVLIGKKWERYLTLR